MLTESEVRNLIDVAKQLLNKSPISFPLPGKYLELEAESYFGKEKFIIDINRKGGSYKITKCTYQNRYNRSEVLVRVDIDGPDHPNPDGTIIPCPHIHIYREGYGLKWAYPLNKAIITNTNDLGQVLIDFLKYNNITNIPNISLQEGGLV